MILDLSRFSAQELLLELCLYAITQINAANAEEMTQFNEELEHISNTRDTRDLDDDLGFMTRSFARGCSLTLRIAEHAPLKVINPFGIQTKVIAAFNDSESMRFGVMTLGADVIKLQVSLRKLDSFDTTGFDSLYGERAVLRVAESLDAKRRSESLNLSPMTPSRGISFSASTSSPDMATRNKRVYNSLTGFTRFITRSESADLSSISARTSSFKFNESS